MKIFLDSSSFPGFYTMQTGNQCWCNDSKRIVLSTGWGAKLVNSFSDYSYLSFISGFFFLQLLLF